eukprot:13566326-Alexandrium_andersonii.AAC.1
MVAARADWSAKLALEKLGLRESVDVLRRPEGPGARGPHPRPREGLAWGAHKQEIANSGPEVSEYLFPEVVVREIVRHGV